MSACFGGSSCKRSSSCRSTSSCAAAAPAAPSPNPLPDPSNFIIERIESHGGWTVAEIRYPDAQNYEGRKILVYRASLDEIRKMTKLDPHFCDHRHCLSPFARFVPTAEGWSAAVALAESMS